MKYSSGGCKGAWQTANVRDGIKEGVDRGMAGQTKPVLPDCRSGERWTRPSHVVCFCKTIHSSRELRSSGTILLRPRVRSSTGLLHLCTYNPSRSAIIRFSHVNLPSRLFPQTIPAPDYRLRISLNRSCFIYISKIFKVWREREREIGYIIKFNRWS